MLRNLMIIGLLIGFLYTLTEVPEKFMELRIQRINNIEMVTNQ